MSRDSRGIGAGPKTGVPRQAREYTFREFLPIYGDGFVASWCSAWAKAFELENPTSVEKWYQPVRRFLATVALLGDTRGPAKSLAEILRTAPTEIDESTLSSAIRHVASLALDVNDTLLFCDVQMRTRVNFVHALNAGLRRLNHVGLLPDFKPASILRRSYRPRHIPSLAEIGRAGREPVKVAVGLSLEEHASVVAHLASTRLEALRGCLEHEFLVEAERFEKGRIWLARDDLPSAEEIDYILQHGSRYRPRGDISGLINEFHAAFSIREDDLPSLPIRWLSRYRGGIINLNPLSERERMLIEFAGGKTAIYAYFEATKIATNALIGLLLIDTAMNVSSVEQLPVDPFVASNTRGRRRIATIASHKMRAGGATVLGHLVEEEAELPGVDERFPLSTVRAIALYQAMSEPLRARGRVQKNSEVDEHLLITTIGKGNSGLVTSDCRSATTQWWPEFIKRNSENEVIGGLPIARNMIRTTVIQLRTSKSGFGHALAQSLGQHKSAATTIGYIDAPWLKAQLAEQIRSFQDLFEAAVTVDLDGYLLGLGFDEETLRKRRAGAIENGLDFFCAAREVPDARPSSTPTCDPLNPCEDCPIRRFHPSRDNLECLCTVHRALVLAEEHLPMANPQRWAAVWLPWRAVTEAYVQKIRRSSLKPLLMEIESSIRQRVNNGILDLPMVS
jgi:hypothetical protein